MTNRTRTDALLLAGFCAFLFFYGAGQFGLIGADEPRYAQVAREMLERHDWITPTLGGRPWLEKPPLYYWQAMLAYSVLGVSDVAARIPAAIDATLLVIAVYLFFRRFRRGVEVDAALITASCAGVVGYARAASMDMALAAAFGIGMLAWWAWRESQKKIYLALFYVFMALGMLAKGPVAPFLAAAVIVFFAAATREWRLILRTLWLPGIFYSARSPCRGTSPCNCATRNSSANLFCNTISPASRATSTTIASRSGTTCPSQRCRSFHGRFCRRRLRPDRCASGGQSANQNPPTPDFEFQFSLFAGCWLIVPVVFFSLSQSKLPGYILPAVPAGAILLANYLLQKFEHEKDQQVPKWLAALHAIVATAPIVPALLIVYLVTAAPHAHGPASADCHRHRPPALRCQSSSRCSAICNSACCALSRLFRWSWRSPPC